MGFIMDGLDAEAYDRQYKDSELVKRIIGYFRPQAPRILTVALVILLASLVNTYMPIFISQSLDRLQQDSSSNTLLTIMAAIIVIGVLSWLFNAIRQWISAAAVGNVTLKLREDAFDAVLKRDLSFYDTFSSGKIVSRVTSDTQAFSQVVTLTMELLSQVLLVVLLIGYLFTVNVELTLITLVISPLVIIVALGFRKIARESITQSRRINAEVSSHIQETVSGISVAKTFRQEHTIYNEFEDVNKQSFRIKIRTGYLFSSIFPILTFIAGLGGAAIVYFGGVRAQEGALTAGEWYLFIQGMGAFWFPLTSIASFWSQFQLGLAAGERVFALIDADPKVVQIDSQKLPQIKGEIRFDHMDFRYTDNEPVLTDFSLTINAGETLALVGHTGSGKSSIGKLIARFYEYQGGKLLIDGHDIRTLDLADYRSRLGIVTQTPFLFDGTVMDNIRYGKPEATDEEVTRAAQMVANGDWISVLPNGLATEVGERGSSLSMGHEATASVDPITEALIQEGLDVVLENRTSIVIAHRLSTIKNADRIIVLRMGEIIEQGTHDSLLAQGGHYAELYNTYFRHQSLEYIEGSRELTA
jgi:ATP-binding cassette, subfamily B, bacterial